MDPARPGGELSHCLLKALELELIHLSVFCLSTGEVTVNTFELSVLKFPKSPELIALIPAQSIAVHSAVDFEVKGGFYSPFLENLIVERAVSAILKVGSS